ncbi:lantibiotic dehydratase [Flavobacterium johnsoniae]|uniref:Thiopeptide-type bacteriocin biosynthesis domain-containing protein n=1 Tax=Flavobacterium johnsoniae TaxID=986 RepID=A0A1J7BP47_FLAJO|nr:lantibiotic dehydratase [Flavobacterium johnsoniae]OIV40467.1 hypothetical protein BKM63_16390 [Flavobacterium johnsoniae]
MNKFLIRTPHFSIDFINTFYRSEDPSQYIYNLFQKNTIFREAIYLNSLVLYNQAIKYSQENTLQYTKKGEKIANSLIRYFLRMSYRATPFGLSAGISIGYYKENPKENIQINYKKRSVKIDSEVLSNILTELNTDPIVKDSLTYYCNNTLYAKNNKYRYFEKKDLVNSFDFALTKVDQNDFLDEILELSKKGINLNDIRLVLKKDDDIEDNDIEDFINELIDSQLIVGDLQYDILTSNFQNKLIQQLESLQHNNSQILNKIFTLLKKVEKLCNELANLPLDSLQGLTIITEIDSLLQNYCPKEKTALQIDLIQSTEFNLPSSIKESIKRKINVFNKINSQISVNTKLKDFKDEFLNRYGNTPMPLLEVLDVEIGIGYPVNLTVRAKSSLLEDIIIETKSVPNDYKLSRWDEFLLDKYELYLKNNTGTITLKTSDFDFIKPLEHKPSHSILFSGQLHRKDDDNHDFFISGLKKGTAQFTAGRFAYNNIEIEKYMSDIAFYEKNQLSDQEVYGEIRHFSQPRLGNISQRPNHYDYYIPIYDQNNKQTDVELSLDDLYLFIENGNIILYSYKLNKRIIPKLSCAQNTTLLTCSIYNFLGEIVDDHYVRFWNWGFLKNKPHLPRVQLEEFILSKERWMIDPATVFAKSGSVSVLKNYIFSNRILRYVTLSTGGDNFIPLDLNTKIGVDFLYEELTKGKIITLEESINLNHENSLIQNQYGRSTHEIHVPILPVITQLKKQKKDNDHIRQIIKENKTINHTKVFPSQQALYFKIYIKNEQADSIILEKLNLILSELSAIKAFDHFFFIRYKDPGYHFRIRFFSDKLNLESILNSLNEGFQEEINSFIIDKIQIDTYEREIERYGGKTGMILSEKIFYYDSICVLNVLLWIEKNDMETQKWIIAMQGVHHLLDDFSTNLNEKITILEQLRDYYYGMISNRSQVNKKVSAFFQEKKKNIEILMDKQTFKHHFFDFFEIRSFKNNSVIAEINEAKIRYDTENYIHMFLNRFFESDQNQQEIIIYDLLIRYYKIIKLKKHNNE